MKGFLLERSRIIEISAKGFCCRESQYLRRCNRQKNFLFFNIHFSKICFFLRQDLYFTSIAVFDDKTVRKSFCSWVSVFFWAGFKHYIRFLVVLMWKKIIWILKNFLTYFEFHLFARKLIGSDQILAHYWTDRKHYSSLCRAFDREKWNLSSLKKLMPCSIAGIRSSTKKLLNLVTLSRVRSFLIWDFSIYY